MAGGDVKWSMALEFRDIRPMDRERRTDVSAQQGPRQVFAVMALALALRAEGNGESRPASLADLSPEELTKIEVSSAARKEQKLLQVPAAAYVITADEMRRSGATTIPEVLRAVPGIQVAQIDSNIWAVTARGFKGRGANKILVLIDGRSIYSALYSGTFWDQNQVPLSDIERIEVSRGPVRHARPRLPGPTSGGR